MQYQKERYKSATTNQTEYLKQFYMSIHGQIISSIGPMLVFVSGTARVKMSESEGEGNSETEFEIQPYQFEPQLSDDGGERSSDGASSESDGRPRGLDPPGKYRMASKDLCAYYPFPQL